MFVCFFFQAEDGIRDGRVTGVQTCALPISAAGWPGWGEGAGRTFLPGAGFDERTWFPPLRLGLPHPPASRAGRRQPALDADLATRARCRTVSPSLRPAVAAPVDRSTPPPVGGQRGAALWDRE